MKILFAVLIAFQFPGPKSLYASDPAPARLLFDETRVNSIEVHIDTSDLSQLLQNVESDEEYEVVCIFHYADRLDTLRNIGIRIKGNTSRYNTKKSFKLSINAFEKGRKYLGLEKINLNAYTNDPTHQRAFLVSKLFEYMDVPVSRISFADIYVNGQYFGLYNIVEHIDEEFTDSRFGTKKGNLYKCLGQAGLSYKGPNIDSYMNPFNGEPIYMLKTNRKENDYTGVLQLIDILNHTPDSELQDALESRFNMESYLKIMAVDILTANWDGYIFNQNNYYLYDNPKTGKFEFIPYDFDNTFGIDWIGVDWGKRDIYDWDRHEDTFLNPTNITGVDEDFAKMIAIFYESFKKDTLRPLYTRVLEVPAYREKFNAHLAFLISGRFNEAYLSAEIDRLHAMLSPSLMIDNQDDYSWEAIDSSIMGPIDAKAEFGSYTHYYLPYGLKEFVRVSRENVEKQIDTPPSLVNEMEAKNQ